MTNYATMRTRILDELVNEKLTSAQVNNAIIEAIRFYKGRSFYFNQILDTLSTVNGTEWYSAATTVTNTAKIKRLLWANVSVNSIKTKLRIRDVEWIDGRQTGSLTGIPSAIGYARQQLRVFPIPNAAYTIQYFAHYEFAEPSGDDDTNAWFTSGESLIRNNAKARLCAGVLQAFDLASGFEKIEMDELARIERETMDSEPDDELRPEPMGLSMGHYNINTD